MKKRERDDEDDSATNFTSPTTATKLDSPPGGPGGTSSNFRNVSACNRCRNRKNRCDQKLPRCSGCEKVNLECVGFDPVSKREIPRSYVYYLETRLMHLESVLLAHNIPYQPPEENFSISLDVKPGFNVPFPPRDEEASPAKHVKVSKGGGQILDPALNERDEHEKLDKLVSDVGMVSVQGTSDTRYLAASSGISFAKVVFAAVKSSVSHMPSEQGGGKKSKHLPSETASGGNTMRDSFFGLHTKPTIKPAPFPDNELGLRLVDLYFEHANPQIPTLHRPEFMNIFERVYATETKRRTPRELYMLNMVFAIGSGIIMDSSSLEPAVAATESGTIASEIPTRKRPRMASRQGQPEEYHSSAIVHLEHFLGSPPAVESYGGGLEELQAVLLLAGLALLRPVAPGLWYIIGVAVRLSIDLGLHFEDADSESDTQNLRRDSEVSMVSTSQDTGRKQWTRDLRRRLWWCVYSLDRLVSTCVGRPFGITDQAIATEFPSLLDDIYITPSGFSKVPTDIERPTYKLVSHHYFRLRLLQSEILQVLQHRQMQQAHAIGAKQSNEYMHTSLPSPFLARFSSFREWRLDVDRRLSEWRDSAPKQAETGVTFTPLFLELNYWQALIMLYRQSVAVPAPLAEELSASTGEKVQSPGSANLEAKEDEEMVFLKVAQAGQAVLRTYRQLHRLKLVNYTFLATHHLFMSGISFLYAIWHSTTVRSQLTIDDVDFTILAATSVLSDLIEKCPPAEACRDAFVRMSKATVTMCMASTGFGSRSSLGTRLATGSAGYFAERNNIEQVVDEEPEPLAPRYRRPMPRFDMDLRDLFSEEEIDSRRVFQQPRSLAFTTRQRSAPLQSSSDLRASSLSSGQHSASIGYIDQSPQSNTGATQYAFQPHIAPDITSSTSYELSGPRSYEPFAENMGYGQADFGLDDLDFLDTFSAVDPSQNFFANSGELDLGFGTGGLAGLDGNGAWEANGGVDLFDGFFFGTGGNGW